MYCSILKLKNSTLSSLSYARFTRREENTEKLEGKKVLWGSFVNHKASPSRHRWAYKIRVLNV